MKTVLYYTIKIINQYDYIKFLSFRNKYQKNLNNFFRLKKNVYYFMRFFIILYYHYLFTYEIYYFIIYFLKTLLL
jgi:hypothetical protein